MKKYNTPKSFSMKHSLITVCLLWIGALIVWLGRYPNQFSAQIFDLWEIILFFASLMILAFGLCRKFRWRSVRTVLIIVCVLFSIVILNFSMWMTIYVQNDTSVTLTAVMTDLSNDRIRMVSIPPGRRKLVELLESESNSFGDVQWHLLVYDEAGTVYLQQVIKGKEIKRDHTIEIDPQSPKDDML